MSDCETVGCDLPATHTVTHRNIVKRVCRRCMEELVAVFGWKLA